MYTVKLDGVSDVSLTLFLVKNVKNIVEVREKITKGELKCCILKPALIVDVFQIVVASNKAVISESAGKLTTKSVYSEILFNLSTSKNISKSLLTFGIDDSDVNVIVAVLRKNQDGIDDIKSEVIGNFCDIDELKGLTDVDLIKKTYKIKDAELKVSTLLNSVITRIATKDIVSY